MNYLAVIILFICSTMSIMKHSSTYLIKSKKSCILEKFTKKLMKGLYRPSFRFTAQCNRGRLCKTKCESGSPRKQSAGELPNSFDAFCTSIQSFCIFDYYTYSSVISIIIFADRSNFLSKLFSKFFSKDFFSKFFFQNFFAIFFSKIFSQNFFFQDFFSKFFFQNFFLKICFQRFFRKNLFPIFFSQNFFSKIFNTMYKYL